MRLTMTIVGLFLVAAAVSVADAQEPADTNQIKTHLIQRLRDENRGRSVDVVPTYRALLNQYAECRGDSVGANCHLISPRPVYLITRMRVTGDSATARVTTYRDSQAHGIVGVSEIWVLRKRGSGWSYVGKRESETVRTH